MLAVLMGSQWKEKPVYFLVRVLKAKMLSRTSAVGPSIRSRLDHFKAGSKKTVFIHVTESDVRGSRDQFTSSLLQNANCSTSIVLKVGLCGTMLYENCTARHSIVIVLSEKYGFYFGKS